MLCENLPVFLQLDLEKQTKCLWEALGVIYGLFLKVFAVQRFFFWIGIPKEYGGSSPGIFPATLFDLHSHFSVPGNLELLFLLQKLLQVWELFMDYETMFIKSQFSLVIKAPG